MRELTPSEKYPPFTRPLMAALSIPLAGPEISDRIAAFDAETLERLPVKKQSVVDEFLSLGNKQAADIVKSLPARDVLMLLASLAFAPQRLFWYGLNRFDPGPAVCDAPPASVLR